MRKSKSKGCNFKILSVSFKIDTKKKFKQNLKLCYNYLSINPSL